MTEDIDVRLSRIESGLTRTETALAKLAEAVVQVARLEVALTHNGEAVERAFSAIEKLTERLEKHMDSSDARLKHLEDQAPISKLVNGWVFAWITGVVGLLGGVAFSKLFQ
jgi:chromosome segregation ATPase